MLVTKLEDIDINPILKEYNLIEQVLQWTDYGHKGKQVGLQYKSNEDIWTSAVGRSQGNEHLYTNLNPFFRGTIFEKLINKYELKRTRLMWVGPYACYSMHVDETARLHIPLITNPECYFIFNNGEITNMPAGSVYIADTTHKHTFANCSPHSRLHLVGVTLKSYGL